MIQGDFRAPTDPRAKGFSGGQFCFGVEPFENATGKLSFGREPVQQQSLMHVEMGRSRAIGSGLYYADRSCRISG